jgi:hypothetical protein
LRVTWQFLSIRARCCIRTCACFSSFRAPSLSLRPAHFLFCPSFHRNVPAWTCINSSQLLQTPAGVRACIGVSWSEDSRPKNRSTHSLPCRIQSTRAQFFLCLDDGLPECSCASTINIPSPVSYHFSSCVTLFCQFMMLIRPSQEASDYRRRCLRQD